MQTKKRAKAAKFGKKIEAGEEKAEEKTSKPVSVVSEQKEETVNNGHANISVVSTEQKNNLPEPVKEEPVIEEKKQMHEVTENLAGPGVTEKISDQVNQGNTQIRDEVQPPVVQGKEVVDEIPVKTVPESVPQVNQEVVSESPVNDNVFEVQTEVKKNLLRYFIIIAIGSFLIGLGSMAGISIFLQKIPFELPFIQRKIAEVTPSSEPTITVEPTKVTVVNLAEYRIEVLNGSGITGAASKLRDVLTTDGFKVLSAGNADKSDYTDTIISAKKNVNSAYLEKLKENLNKTYTSVIDSKTSVPESSEADVIITIGSSTAQN